MLSCRLQIEQPPADESRYELPPRSIESTSTRHTANALAPLAITHPVAAAAAALAVDALAAA
jgi:hypothetical protein